LRSDFTVRVNAGRVNNEPSVCLFGFIDGDPSRS
jgi:hypothetical protein